MISVYTLVVQRIECYIMDYPTNILCFLSVDTSLSSYPSRNRCIAILYHAIENAVANTINVENDVKVGSVPGVG